MTERIARLRAQSADARQRVDPSRAIIVTESYKSFPLASPLHSAGHKHLWHYANKSQSTLATMTS